MSFESDIIIYNIGIIGILIIVVGGIMKNRVVLLVGLLLVGILSLYLMGKNIKKGGKYINI